MPKVSVIIATHSRPHLLPRAVKSAFEAGTDVEVIVVDDASTDATAEVCKNLIGIKYIRVERNQRTAGARNIGILASCGEYISFHDDDDLRLPGSLDLQVAVLEDNPGAGMVYGKAWIGDADCRPTGTPVPIECPAGDVFWRLIEGNFIICITAVFRKSCLSSIGLIDQTLAGVDDYDLWIRIAELYPFAVLEEPVAIWRESLENSGQGSSDKIKELMRMKFVSEKSLSLPRALEDPARRATTSELIKEKISEFLLWNASEQLKTGNSANSRKSILAALKCDKKRVLRPGVIKLLVRSFMLK